MEKETIKVLIVDGQNNHKDWPKTSLMMKAQLEETGLFEVNIERSKYTWNGQQNEEYLSRADAGDTEDLKEPKQDPDFSPDFMAYDVVVSNFGWKAAPWPAETMKNFEDFVRSGGGFVSVHAADNSFPEWKAYNKMIGLGGWGGRNEKDGPYVYYDEKGKLIRDNSPGPAGAHGAKNNFTIHIRNSKHPITKGMPDTWISAKDECYARLRGPAKKMKILATGEDLTYAKRDGRHEPVFMVIKYGKGRVFHTTLGHDQASLEGVGFISSFTRGVEWAATGKVTLPIPEDFPTKDESRSRPFTFY
jgi:type 1 glutamine amidotransferase